MVRRKLRTLLQMLPRRIAVARSLVRSRNSKLRRSMEWEYRYRLPIRRNRRIVLLQLRVQIADKVKRVRLVRRDLRHAFERGNRFRQLARIFQHQPQVVPGKRVVRPLLRRLAQRRERRVRFLLRHQRNSQIQFRQRIIPVRGKRRIKFFLRVAKPLLPHVRHANAVPFRRRVLINGLCRSEHRFRRTDAILRAQSRALHAHHHQCCPR